MQIWKDNRPYLAQAIERINELKAENERLREALKSVLPPAYGEYGGPLVYIQAHYEDASEKQCRVTPYTKKMKISHEDVEKARAALERGEEE